MKHYNSGSVDIRTVETTSSRSRGKKVFANDPDMTSDTIKNIILAIKHRVVDEQEIEYGYTDPFNNRRCEDMDPKILKPHQRYIFTREHLYAKRLNNCTPDAAAQGKGLRILYSLLYNEASLIDICGVVKESQLTFATLIHSYDESFALFERQNTSSGLLWHSIKSDDRAFKQADIQNCVTRLAKQLSELCDIEMSKFWLETYSSYNLAYMTLLHKRLDKGSHYEDNPFAKLPYDVIEYIHKIVDTKHSELSYRKYSLVTDMLKSSIDDFELYVSMIKDDINVIVNTHKCQSKEEDKNVTSTSTAVKISDFLRKRMNYREVRGCRCLFEKEIRGQIYNEPVVNYVEYYTDTIDGLNVMKNELQGLLDFALNKREKMLKL